MKQNSPKYYKVYTAADGRVCIASVEFAADFGANAPENCPCMGYIKVMHGNKRADAPCYLMPAKMAKLLKPEEYRPAPTGGSSPAAPKSRPDSATMALYWLLTEAAAFADAEPFRVFDNGQWHTIAKEAPDMLKRLKREFNITKSDLKTYPPTVAPAPVQDQQHPEPAAAPVADSAAVVFTDSMDDAIEARTSEAVTLPAWAVDGVRCVYDSRDEGKLTGTADSFHWSAVGHCWLCDFTSGHTSIIGALVERMTPAPVEDIEAAVVAHFEDLAANAPDDDPAADILRAGIETGKVIICSVPKAEPTTPTNEKTEPTPAPVKKRKELAEYHGAIVEVVEHRKGDAIIKYKYGAGGLANYEDLKPTTAKKTALPEWLQSFCILETESGIFRLDAVGQKNMHYYRPDGFYYSSSVARFIDSYGHTVKNWHIDPEFAPEETEPDPDAIGEIVTIPAEQKTAPTDAEVMETAARIRANYEAEREQAAAAFAEADSQPAGISCDDLPDTTPIYTAADVEKIIEAATADTYTADEVAAMVAAAVAEERARHTRRRFAPRLRPVLHRLGRVAAVVLPLLLVALFVGASTDAAPAADTETVAQVIDLPAVTVTAEAPDTFIEDEAPRLIEDKAPAPSPVKKLAAPSPVKNAAADAVTLPNQKTVPDIATATAPAADDADSLTTAPAAPLAPAADADGLTICEGTPWAYTMMNWA